MKIQTFTLFTGLTLTSVSMIAGVHEKWAGFRGDGSSLTKVSELPLKWDQETAQGWKTSLEGRGQSSPVVFQKQIFVTSVDGPDKEKLWMQALDVETGAMNWKKSVDATATRKMSSYISYAAPTPVVDADRVYAFFEEGDFLAWDHSGDLKWRVSLSEKFGQPVGNHGQGSSPVLTDYGIVALVDQKEDSYLVSFDKASGEILWKTPRTTSTAWSTPTLVNRNGIQTLVISASGTLKIYRALDGKELGSFDEALDGNNVPSPTVSGDWVVIGARKRGSNLVFQLKESGDELFKFEPSWEARKATSTFGSPLIHEGRVYFVSDAGIVYAYRLQDGEPLFEERIESSTWASPLGAPGRVYFFGSNGTTTVLAAEDDHKVLSVNSLPIDEKDRIYGYAIMEKGIIIRSENTIQAILNP